MAGRMVRSLRQRFQRGVLVMTPALLLLQDVSAAAPHEGVVKFGARQVDLGAFLDSFPYDEDRWQASLKHDVLYLLKSEGGKTHIHRIDLGSVAAPAVLGDSLAASTDDLSQSVTYYWKVNDADGSLFFIMDERNNESFNLYALTPAGEMRKLTDVDYVAGYGFSRDGKQVAYTERSGREGSPIRIHVLDLSTHEDRVIATDSPSVQFTWGDLSWQPDGTGIVLTTLTDGDRNRGNLAYVATDGDERQKPRILTNPAVPRTFPSATRYWMDGKSVLMLSNENGANNLFDLDTSSGAQRPLTDFGSDVTEVSLQNGSRRVFLTVTNPLTTSIYELDLSQPAPKPKRLFSDGYDRTLLDVGSNGELLFHVKSSNLPFRVESKIADDEAGQQRARVLLDAVVMKDIVHCQASPLMYNTFDDLPMTLGEDRFQGKIHGYLYVPLNPPQPQDRLLLVEAFYGGTNTFNLHTQILCAAGVYVFSPAPRGVANISSEFEKLNDGDMGGYEVIDVMYGGRFVGEKLGIPPSRTGVFGHSHGGYEAMRQMTFPGHVGDVDFAFPWGFGIAEAGFGSIEGQYEEGNIKYWIVKEAGHRSGWADRSPINHTGKLKGNLLLIHGTNDQRVPFAESKALYDKLVAEGKKDLVTLVPLTGVGHATVARKDVVARYTAWFEFLEGQFQGRKSKPPQDIADQLWERGSVQNTLTIRSRN
jgi:dipeptidyl aminopeptidase/acylaminoacyl peptidase